MREIILDVETTGLAVHEGHRIIEVAAVELDGVRIGRRWHSLFDPGRPIDPAATAVHNIINSDLKGQPKFKDMAASLAEFIGEATLIAHNSPFDAGFLRAEMRHCPEVEWNPVWIDTLPLARKKLPRKKHTLDALCIHYGIRKSKRQVHGALLDVLLLAEVYARLIGRLDQLNLDGMEGGERVYLRGGEMIIVAPCDLPHPGPRPQPLQSRLTLDELRAHKAFMKQIEEDRHHPKEE
jgi:DNA polymerase-3 subunit epsilon